MKTDEIDAVVELWHETRKDTHTFIELEKGVTLAHSRDAFLEKILPLCSLWVATEADDLLGFLAIRGSYLDRIYVRPSVQRRAVGTALLAKARELSPRGLELHTHQKNIKARSFYEKHGFRAVRFGTSPPPENEPDVEYHWRPET
jgi:ribosomal protein S18 acetylase RimI-like enzyme